MKMNRHTKKDIIFGEINKQYKEIYPKPRKVFLSKELSDKLNTNLEWQTIIEEIKSRCECGDGLNEYLHREKIEEKHSYNEKFLNATRFHHLHFVNYDGIKNGKRSDYHLYIHVTSENIYMIDILKHGDFGKKPVSLYNIVNNNWNILSPTIFQSRNAIKSSDEDIAKAIQGNVNAVITLDDCKEYFMLGQISTDGSSGIALTVSDKIKDTID